MVKLSYRAAKERGTAVLVAAVVGAMVIAALGVICLAAYKIKAESFEFSADPETVLVLDQDHVAVRRGRRKDGQPGP